MRNTKQNERIHRMCIEFNADKLNCEKCEHDSNENLRSSGFIFFFQRTKIKYSYQIPIDQNSNGATNCLSAIVCCQSMTIDRLFHAIFG